MCVCVCVCCRTLCIREDGIHSSILKDPKVEDNSESSMYSEKIAGEHRAMIDEHYNIMHTLDLNEMVNSLAIYCHRQGGALI